jgi:hypothetical protein
MEAFDPIRGILNSSLALESDGAWPSFHDAEVHSLKFWRGDMRPDDDMWIGAVVEATLELTALIEPFIVVLKFHDCDSIEMKDFNHSNMIYSLQFSIEDRGFFGDNITPLPPYIAVKFGQSFGVALTFKCFKIEVVERREVEPGKYA